MTNDEKAKKYLIQACEMCENYSTTNICENRYKCPVYSLYEMALNAKTKIIKNKDNWTGCQGNNDFEPNLNPEMI